MFDRILIAVDGSDCALRGTRVGLELAVAADATVDAVHVTPPGGGEHASTVLDEVAATAAESGGVTGRS